MRKRFVSTALLIIIIAPGALAQSPPGRHGDRTGASIAAETMRLKGILASLKLPDADGEIYAGAFSRVERARQSGHVFLSLFLLHPSAATLPAIEYQKAKAEVEKGGLEALEREWRRLGGELAEKERRLTAAPARRHPLAVQAMLERALTQVQPHYQSGRLYGQQTTIDAGLFYLGRAKAQLDFALFCRGLDAVASGAAPSLRSLAPELEELEREVTQAYRRLGAADQDNTFIRINASLKVAQDLERERRFGGALLQYLEVFRALEAVNSMPAESLAPEALKSLSESFRAQLSGDKTDHSVGWLYWQMAQTALESGDANDLKQAAVILRHVAPRYFKYMSSLKEGPAPKAVAGEVTVTLARWPYT
jgi:hypothetical protein